MKEQQEKMQEKKRQAKGGIILAAASRLTVSDKFPELIFNIKINSAISFHGCNAVNYIIERLGSNKST